MSHEALLPPISPDHKQCMQTTATEGQLHKSHSEVIIPRNQEDWQSKTAATLSRVSSLTKDVFQTVHQNHAAEAAARAAVLEQKEKLRKKQRVKVHGRMKQHEAIIKASYACTKEVKHSIVQVEGAQERLTAERYQRFAGTKVCEYRLDLRAKRPEPELYVDSVQQALEKEMHFLNTARQELLNKEDQAKRFLAELQTMCDTMAKDIGNRRLAMKKDMATISAGQDAPLCSPECISDQRSGDVQQESQKLAEAALRFKDECEGLVSRIKKESVIVSKRVANCLRLHTQELAGMRKKLAAQVTESETAFDKAELQLSHMMQRTGMGDSAMAQRVGKMEALLRDLGASRRKTTEDLRNKTIALEIDNSCRKVTAQMASGEPASKMGHSTSAPSLSPHKMATATDSFKMTLRSPSGASPNNPQQGDNENDDIERAGGRSPMRQSGIDFAYH